MSFARILQPIEEKIVDMLLNYIPYLSPAVGGTCRGVADIRTAMEYLDIGPPVVLVMAGPEESEEPKQMASGNQFARQYWRVMAMAASFTSSGEGRNDSHVAPGAYSMLDDIDGALRGRFGLPGLQNSWKLFKAGQTQPEVIGATVTGVSTWWHRVHRQEQIR